MSTTGDSGLSFGGSHAIAAAERSSSSSGVNTSGGVVSTDGSFQQVTPIAPIAEFLDGTSTPTPRAIADSETPPAITDRPSRRSRSDRSRSNTPRGSGTSTPRIEDRSRPPVRSIMDLDHDDDNTFESQAEIIRELRLIIRQRDNAYAEMFAQGQDYIANMESAAQLEINYLLHEVKKRDSALEQQASLMQTMNQEDEGAAYRIEELTRMRDLSGQVAEHINARYQELSGAYQEQRREAQSALGNMYSSAKDHVDSLRLEIQEAQRRGLQEEYAAQHAVRIHAEMSDRYHEMVGELHGQLNKMYEEKSRAQNSLSMQNYDIAYMQREHEEEIREHDKRICKHESFAYIAEIEESRAVAKMEFFENKMEAMQSEMSVNQRLQIRDRTNDAELARAKMEIQLLEQELKNSQRHLSETRDKYNYLECDVAEDWNGSKGMEEARYKSG